MYEINKEIVTDYKKELWRKYEQKVSEYKPELKFGEYELKKGH